MVDAMRCHTFVPALLLGLATTAIGVLAGAPAQAATNASGQMGLRGLQLLASSVGQSAPRLPTGAEVLPGHVSRATRIGQGEMPTFSAAVPRLAKGFVARGAPPTSFRQLGAMRPQRSLLANRRSVPRGVTVFRPGWGGRPAMMRPARFGRTNAPVAARPAVRPPAGQRSQLQRQFTARVRSPMYRGR